MRVPLTFVHADTDLTTETADASAAGANSDLNRFFLQQQLGLLPRGAETYNNVNYLRQQMAGAAESTDPLVAHLRQNLLDQQLERSRFQGGGAGVDASLSYLSNPSPAAGANPMLQHIHALREQQQQQQQQQQRLGMNMQCLPPFASGAAGNPQLAAAILLEQARHQVRRQGGGPRVPSDPPADADTRGEGVEGVPSDSLRSADRNNDHSQTSQSERVTGRAPDAEALRHFFNLQGHGRAAAGMLPGNLSMLHPLLAAQGGIPPGLGQDVLFGHPRLSSLPGVGGNAETGQFGSPYNTADQAASGAGARGVAATSPGSRRGGPGAAGREPIHLYMTCDDDDLSPYQCLVRKQIELFEATEEDAESNARGRNRPIVVGQVGIRCKHCKILPPRKRERAAIYYPSRLDRLCKFSNMRNFCLVCFFLYGRLTTFLTFSLVHIDQAGQTMASTHLGQHCRHIPEHLRAELSRLREGKSAALAGRKYWSDAARALGVYEDDGRLFFER